MQATIVDETSIPANVLATTRARGKKAAEGVLTNADTDNTTKTTTAKK